MRLIGFAMATGGVLPVLYLLALLVWQYIVRVQAGTWPQLPASLAFTDHTALQAAGGKISAVAVYLPQLPAAWLAAAEARPDVQVVVTWLLQNLHIGVVFALLGLLVTWVGVRLIMRQSPVIRYEKELRANRRRRVRLNQYGATERLEPFIGDPAIPTRNPADARRAA